MAIGCPSTMLAHTMTLPSCPLKIEMDVIIPRGTYIIVVAEETVIIVQGINTVDMEIFVLKYIGTYVES